MGIVFWITASGQYIQQRKQAGFFCLAGVHLLLFITGIRLRHSPVFPASPMAGDDSSQICLQSRVFIVLNLLVELGYFVCFFNSSQIDINGVIGKSFPYHFLNIRQVHYLRGAGESAQHRRIYHGQSSDH